MPWMLAEGGADPAAAGPGGCHTPKPALPSPLPLEGSGTSPPKPAGRSAGRRAGTLHGQDYKSHNAPDSGGGEGGGGAFRCRRPRRLPPGSGLGSAMEPVEPGGESSSRARAHPASPSSQSPALPAPESPAPSRARGLGAGDDGIAGDGEGEAPDPELDLGSPRGPGLERLPEEARSRAARVGPGWVGGGTLGRLPMPKGGV